jgi:NAD-dependent dihydropyrimidine dehydrogenase PreA subunit
MKTIVYCSCSHYPDLVPSEKRMGVLSAINTCDAEVVIVSDLCKLAANKDPELARMRDSDELVIVACHPRAVSSLFHAGGAPLKNGRTEILNLRSQSAEEIARRLTSLMAAKSRKEKVVEAEPDHADEWTPWFPAIDRSRCKNCKQCLSFCLFGVYEADEKGRVVVKNPRNCKTNCPACSRICPEVAIIFPKSAEAPINGAEINDEQAARANVKVNMEKILGSDPYKALAERKKQAKMRLVDRDKLKQR